MAAGLSFSHGANDAQKSMGVIAALLLAAGRLQTFEVPLWAKVGCGAAITLGTALGGWRIVAHDRPRDLPPGADRRFASQTGSTAVILARLVPGGSGLDDPRRRLLGGRGRQRAAALAARPLDRRAVDRLRLAA